MRWRSRRKEPGVDEWARCFRLEQPVEDLDRDRAFTDGGRHPLHGPVPNVAHRQHSGQARLERERRAVERPALVSTEVRPREHEALSVSAHLRRQPFRVRLRADRQEEPVRGDRLLGAPKSCSLS